MFAGDTFTVDQRRAIDKALRQAEEGSGLDFHVRIGGDEDGEPRRVALDVLQRMPDPARSVVLVVEPGQRAIEIVTGSVARRSLSDESCGLALLGMQGSFQAGDLPGGLVSGIHQLAEHARAPQTLHTETAGHAKLTGASARDPRSSGSSAHGSSTSGATARDPRH